MALESGVSIKITFIAWPKDLRDSGLVSTEAPGSAEAGFGRWVRGPPSDESVFFIACVVIDKAKPILYSVSESGRSAEWAGLAIQEAHVEPAFT